MMQYGGNHKKFPDFSLIKIEKNLKNSQYFKKLYLPHSQFLSYFCFKRTVNIILHKLKLYVPSN